MPSTILPCPKCVPTPQTPVPATEAHPQGQVLADRPPTEDLFGRALLQLWHQPGIRPVHEECRSACCVASMEPAGAERRDYPRRSAHGHASIVVWRNARLPTCAELDQLLSERGHSGELLDLSRNGFAVVMLSPPAAGETILVRLTHPQLEQSIDAPASVIRVYEMGEGLFKIVAHFLTPLDFDTTYALCDHQ